MEEKKGQMKAINALVAMREDLVQEMFETAGLHKWFFQFVKGGDTQWAPPAWIEQHDDENAIKYWERVKL